MIKMKAFYCGIVQHENRVPLNWKTKSYIQKVLVFFSLSTLLVVHHHRLLLHMDMEELPAACFLPLNIKVRLSSD